MTKRLKCFISAPATTNISILRKYLDKLDVEAYDPYDFIIGERIHDSLTKRIKEADFAIIVISEPNSGVFYEMGIGEGMGKPLFVIVGKDVQPPYFVQKYVYFRTDLELVNEELLEISINRFIQDLRSKKAKTKRKPKEFPSHSLPLDSANDYLKRIQSLRTAGDPLAIERLVDDLFNSLTLQFQWNHYGHRNEGVDFAVWDDNLALTIGNPLFIEVKSGGFTFDRIRQGENQLRGYLAKTDAKAAIFLYLDKDGKRFHQDYSVAPLILRFDLEDFVRDLSIATFKDVVLSQRNRMVHGVSE